VSQPRPLMAPAWPSGRDTFRSFRVRFGEHDAGVLLTRQANLAHVSHVTHSHFMPLDALESNQAELRLWNGNISHKPIVEWITIEVDAHQERLSIRSARGRLSIADEGLTLAWLCPERVSATNYTNRPAWYMAGYEANWPAFGNHNWGMSPCLMRDQGGYPRLDMEWLQGSL